MFAVLGCATKLPARKCLISADVGSCGVGASGSTVAMTNFCRGLNLPVFPRMANVGGPTVAGTEGGTEIQIRCGMMSRIAYRPVGAARRHEG